MSQPKIVSQDPVAVRARFSSGIPGSTIDRSLILQGQVDDAALRAKLPGFDGLERPFVLYPTAAGSEWKRLDFSYQEPPNNGNGGRVPSKTDSYWGELFLSKADAQAIKEQGVAFGVDTNRGTFWLQQPGDNTIPDDL